MMQQVFSNATTASNSATVSHQGGDVEIVVDGTFDGATVTLYAKYPATNVYVPFWQGQWSEPQVRILKTVRPCVLRLAITSPGASTSINAWI